MLITILTSGTRGDVQPYIALGLELKKVGYSVRLATFENYGSFVTGFGLEFYPIKGDISMIAASDDTRHAKEADNPLRLLLSFNKLKAHVFDLQKDFYDACTGSDAIIFHPGVALGYYVAQQMKIPSILALPFPMTPTKAYPSMIFYDMVRLGGSFNYLSHKIFQQIMWMASSDPIKEFWKQKFGAIPKGFGNPFPRQMTRSQPTIVSCSNYVFPKPDDWSEHVYNTGYWFLEEETGWEPSAELLKFLQNGEPPVYVGFGSIGDSATADQTTELVIDALKRSGQRGVLATGWSGMASLENLPENIFVVESVPHSWLFPRMAAVVHHGGAGTTAAGLRAGVPSMIIPHSNDQFAWGRRVYELGVGSKPIPRKNLTAERLADAIRFALSKEVKDAAKELGRKIQSESGAESAARIVMESLTAPSAP